MKICLVASRGGHLEEIQFARELNGTKFLITEASSSNVTLCEKVYYVKPINRREPDALLKTAGLFVQANRILNREQPDCIISTGALIAVPVLILGKLKKKKIVYLESLARVEDLSLSGKIIYPIADVFCVYWKRLQEKYPKAHYIDLFGEE